MRAKFLVFALLLGGLALLLEPTSSMSQYGPPGRENPFVDRPSRKGRPRFGAGDAPDRGARGNSDNSRDPGSFPKTKGRGRDGSFRPETDRRIQRMFDRAEPSRDYSGASAPEQSREDLTGGSAGASEGTPATPGFPGTPPLSSGSGGSTGEGSVGLSLPAAPGEQDDRRPVVNRAGKLPPGLPDWFTQLDTDGDGQIGLYEWKHSGRPLEEFQAMDRNDDGFLTVEEVLRYVRQEKDWLGRSADR